MMRNIKCEQLEVRNGYTNCREEDRNWNEYKEEFTGKVHVFYTVNDDELMLESFKTLREARKFADNN